MWNKLKLTASTNGNAATYKEEPAQKLGRYEKLAHTCVLGECVLGDTDLKANIYSTPVAGEHETLSPARSEPDQQDKIYAPGTTLKPSQKKMVRTV